MFGVVLLGTVVGGYIVSEYTWLRGAGCENNGHRQSRDRVDEPWLHCRS